MKDLFAAGIAESRESARKSPAPNSVLLWSLAGVFLISVAAIYAFCVTFAGFADHDDEGFMMITVEGFLKHTPLYDGIASYYGPMYYFYRWVIHGLLSIPLTHDVNRCLTVIHWIGAALLLGLVTWRLTRSPLLGVLAFTQGTVHLEPIASDPGHPQELEVVLLGLAALVATQGVSRRWVLPVLGAICGTLTFTKINVGGYFGFALLLTVISFASFLRPRYWMFLTTLGLCSVVPFLIMQRHLGESWAWHYSSQVCLGILSTGVIAFSRAGERQVEPSRCLEVACAFAGVCAVGLGLLVLTGSSLSATFQSLVAEPAKFSGVVWLPFHAERYAWSAIGSFLLAGVTTFLSQRQSRWLDFAWLAKGVYGLTASFVFFGDPHTQLGGLLPWVWLVLLPNRSSEILEPNDGFVRSFLGLTVVWQGLQAYPVIGPHAAIATMLCLVIYSLCLHDFGKVVLPFAANYLRRRAPFRPIRVGVVEASVLLTVLCLFATQWTNALARWRYYVLGGSLGLPGARWVHARPSQVRIYQALAGWVESQCDTFYTFPGFNSLHFWTSKPPPTYLNISGECVMPTATQQAQIVAAIKAAKRPLVITKTMKLHGEVHFGKRSDGPFDCFIDHGCREVKQLGEFRILELSEATTTN